MNSLEKFAGSFFVYGLPEFSPSLGAGNIQATSCYQPTGGQGEQTYFGGAHTKSPLRGSGISK